MPPDSPAATGCPTLVPLTAPVVLKLRANTIEVPAVRRYLIAMLAGLVPAGHLDEVELCASELVTNALKAALDYAKACRFAWTHLDTPIHLGICCAERWTRLDVRDPDPVLPAPVERDLLDEHGKGLILVNEIAACRWWEPAADHKTVHAVIAMPLVELTAAELKAARHEQ